VDLEPSYREAMQEFVGEGRHDELRSLPRHADFASFVAELEEWSRGRGLPDGWVPGSTFWLVHGVRFVGLVEVRHRLTDALRMRGGHVGYSIRPTMRGHGFGRRVLALALPRCLELGIERVLVTCDQTNRASRRIIEANGGELEDAVKVPERPVPTMRYWIDVRAQLRRASDAEPR
jgi:predicted acetyltransferase